MGSLSSRPQVPSQPTVVYVPQSTPTTTPSTTSSGGTTSNPTSNEGGGEAQARTQNLLQRSRGRFGTIQTSFRGLLAITDALTGRKTLLGE